MTQGIISNTIVINLGDSLNNINEVKKGLKDVRAALKTMEQDQGKSAMVNGTLMDAKELRNVMQRLQGDIKALQGSTSKSTATDGIKKGAEEATKEFRTLKQAVKDVEKAIDKAQQSASQTAKYKGQTLDMPQLYAKHSEALQRVQVMEAGFAQNREKALQAEQKLRSDIAAKKLADEQRYQAYIQRESLAAGKANTSDNYRREIAQASLYQRDERKQNSAYNDYYGNMARQNNADVRRDIAQSEAYRRQQKLNDDNNDKFMVAREKRYQAEMALDTKQANAYDVHQRKQFQRHIDDIVKRENADKLSYDQYLNRLTNKYNAEGKANDAANNRYIQGLARQDAREAQLFAQYNAKQNRGGAQDYVGYASKVAADRAEAERLYRVMKELNTEQSKIDFANAKKGLRESEVALNSFNKAIGTSHGLIDGMGRRIRSHLEWIVSGGLITAFAALPMMIENIARETEVLGQKLKQNLELAERYRDNHHGLEEDVRHLGDVAATFAVGYGANIKDVLEMMQVLSRRFKSPEELTYYTNLAMVMHKLDFVSPKKAAEDLEAVVLSMGLDFKGAKKFIDEFSVAVDRIAA